MTRHITATWGVLIIIFGIGALIYSNTLHVPFVFDDLPNIVENPHIRMTAVTPQQIARIKDSPSPRPFANLTVALNYYFHQYRPFGYHLFNILIHIITAWLVFLVAGQTLSLSKVKAIFLPSLTAALIWLAHPLHTQSVTYIIQRMNALAAMFYLLTLTCYIAARRIPRGNNHALLKKSILFAAAALSGVLGLGSKPTAATLPVMLFFYEWFFFQDINTAWLKKNIRWAGLLLILFLSIALLYLGADPLNDIQSLYDTQQFTLGQRILTEPLVIIYYISLLIFPHPSRLNLDYNFPLSWALFSPPETILGPVTFLVLLAALIYTAKKNRLAAFAGIWFLVTLSIESSFIGLALIFEHRTYLPSVFPVVAAIAFAFHHFSGRRAAAATLSFVLLGVIGLGGFWTWQRNTVWSDEITFWRDCVDKTPHSGRLLNNLGTALLLHNDIDGALLNLKKAVAVDPKYYKAYNNIGIARYRQHRPEEAISWYRRALDIRPDFAAAYSNLGVALLSTGRTGEALTCCRKAVAISPDYAMAHSNLGLCLAHLGHPRRAVPFYRQALKLDPELPQAHYNLGETLLNTDRIKQALPHLQTALKADPDNATYLNKLADAFYRNGNYAAAIPLFERLRGLRPDLPKIDYNLACLHARQNNIQQAVLYLKKAVKNGYADWQKITTDPDLATVRASDQYERLLNNRGR